MKRSNVEVGTAFEMAVKLFWNNIGELRRLGGANDQGIDLRGRLGKGTLNIPVVMQCKATKNAVGPRYCQLISALRDWEGAVGKESVVNS
jgi:Protein of unknown function (DUF2034)